MSFAWMSDPQYLAQVAHFLGAGGVALLAALFSMARRASWRPIIWTVVVGIPIAAFKEFVFDLAMWGEGDTLADSGMDFSFYMLGAAVGLGLVAWAMRIAVTA